MRFLLDYYNFPEPIFKLPANIRDKRSELFETCKKYRVTQEKNDKYLTDITRKVIYHVAKNNARIVYRMVNKPSSDDESRSVISYEFNKYIAIKISKKEATYILIINCEPNNEYFTAYNNGVLFAAQSYRDYASFNTIKATCIVGCLGLAPLFRALRTVFPLSNLLKHISNCVKCYKPSTGEWLFDIWTDEDNNVINNLCKYQFKEADQNALSEINDKKQPAIPESLLCVVCKVDRISYAFTGPTGCGHFIYCERCVQHDALRERCAMCSKEYAAPDGILTKIFFG